MYRGYGVQGVWAMGPMDNGVQGYGQWGTGVWGPNAHRAPLPMCPIGHVTYCPCGPYPLYPISPVLLLPMGAQGVWGTGV